MSTVYMTLEEVAARVSPEWLSERCVEEGDCLLWKLSTNTSNQPRYTFKQGGKPHTRHLRQVVWIAAGNSAPRVGHCISMSCGDPRCLNHLHMKVTTKAKVMSITRNRPEVKRSISIAITKRQRKIAKLTMEQARYVREAEDKSHRQLAQELGVSRQQIGRIRSGDAWKEMLANPFSGLGA